MDKLLISISIADRTYKPLIEIRDEELFRKAAKLIDKKIKDYSENYAYKDKQDLLAMVALEYMTTYLRKEQETITTEDDLVTNLSGMHKALDEILRHPV